MTVDDARLAKRWILVGALSGILAGLDYFVAVSGVLPVSARVVYPIFWFFGPLLVVASFGFYHFFRPWGASIALELARLFVIIAGVLVCLMGTMQGVSREHFGRLDSGWPEGASEAMKMGFRGANSIQSGADLAWDMFIFLGMAMLGIAMLRAGVLWMVLGSLGVLIGLVGLGFNLWVWPANPGTAGLVDAGPFAGLWFTVVTVIILTRYRSIPRGRDRPAAAGGPATGA